MLYSNFQDKKLSLLGFGAMRLPQTDGQVDTEQVRQMVRLGFAAGVNYIDTAWPYHNGQSERVLGQVLADYPRESYFLADKFPGHQLLSSYDPAPIFEEQLRRCRVDYFDFYLLHNVYENSLDTYLNPEYGILPYLREQKRLGRIRHLGFSTHARLDTLERILDVLGADVEFCQIQLNYLDWSLQDAKAKYDLLTARGIPVWVMEPVRGGKLAAFRDSRLDSLRPGVSTASWAFRFLQDLPNVKMILSGMSNLQQMEDNLGTFAAPAPLSASERQLLLDLAEEMKNAIPCTGCRYCVEGCPAGLDIPRLMATCSDLRFETVVNSVMALQMGPESQLPSACIGCGKCKRICPQGIDIPAVLEELSQRLAAMPQWRDICRQREAAQQTGPDGTMDS